MSPGQATNPSGSQNTPRVPVGPPRMPGSLLLSPELPPRVGLRGLTGKSAPCPEAVYCPRQTWECDP